MEPIEIRGIAGPGGHGGSILDMWPLLVLLLCIWIVAMTIKILTERPVWHFPLVVIPAVICAYKLSMDNGGFLFFLIPCSGAVGAVYLFLQLAIGEIKARRR
jgi:hypothetical protein